MFMCLLQACFHLVFGRPFFSLVCLSSVLFSLCALRSFSSHVHTISVISPLSFLMLVLLQFFLTCSFLILSFFVIPHKNFYSTYIFKNPSLACTFSKHNHAWGRQKLSLEHGTVLEPSEPCSTRCKLRCNK